MKRLPQQHRNPRVRRERDTAALRRQIVLLACGLTVACGFVFAVGQHYAAVRYGYDGERLRDERKQLLAERDRLMLELNQAESPVTLERAARELGMQPTRSSQMGGAQQRHAAAGARAEKNAGALVADKRVAAKGAREAQPSSTETGARKPLTDAARETPARGGDSRPRIVEAADARGR